MSGPNALLSRLQTYPSCSLDHSELAHPIPVEFGGNTSVDSVIQRMDHPTAAIRRAGPLTFAASPRETGAKFPLPVDRHAQRPHFRVNIDHMNSGTTPRSKRGLSAREPNQSR